MEKWLELERHLRQESTLLPERTAATTLRSAFHAGRLATIEEGERIIAIAAIWPSPHPTWWEVGTIWVHTDCKGRRLSGVVFADAFRKLQQLSGDGAFLITYRVGVAAMVIASGWVETQWDVSTIPAQATAGRRHRHTSGQRPLHERRLFCYPLRVADQPLTTFLSSSAQQLEAP